MGLRRIPGAARRILPRMVVARYCAQLCLRRRVWRRSAAGAGRAETIDGALVKAYLTNPDINSQRAAVRQTDEGVPEANAGYLPKMSVVGNMAVAHVTGNQIIPGEPAINYSTGAFPRGYGVQGTETVFDGYQTINRIRTAEIPGDGGARTVAQHRAEHPALRRHCLHGRARRHRNPGPR